MVSKFSAQENGKIYCRETGGKYTLIWESFSFQRRQKKCAFGEILLTLVFMIIWVLFKKLFLLFLEAHRWDLNKLVWYWSRIMLCRRKSVVHYIKERKKLEKWHNEVRFISSAVEFGDDPAELSGSCFCWAVKHKAVIHGIFTRNWGCYSVRTYMGVSPVRRRKSAYDQTVDSVCWLLGWLKRTTIIWSIQPWSDQAQNQSPF